MNLDILGNLGEFLGAIGVIVSLIYLAGQIRQNTRAVYNRDFREFVERERELQGPTDPRQWAPASVLPQSSD